jgi:hypothetical protein
MTCKNCIGYQYDICRDCYDDDDLREYANGDIRNVCSRFQPKKFFDIETREIITEDVLAATLEELKECDPDTYGDITLGQYINNCMTINNGTLEEI